MAYEQVLLGTWRTGVILLCLAVSYRYELVRYHVNAKDLPSRWDFDAWPKGRSMRASMNKNLGGSMFYRQEPPEHWLGRRKVVSS